MAHGAHLRDSRQGAKTAKEDKQSSNFFDTDSLLWLCELGDLARVFLAIPRTLS
jgi:hypothetical protein